MDARVLVSIWYCHLSIFNVINPTLSITLKQNDYNENKSTENFQPAVPTERLENLAYTVPMESAYQYELVAGRRFYRNIDSEAITSTKSTVVTERSSSFVVNDLTDKYTETTNSINTNNPSIPLTSTEPYDFAEPPNLTVSKENGTNMPIITTENYLDISDVTENDNTFTTPNLLIGNEHDVVFESTTNLNEPMETLITPTEQLSSKESIGTVELNLNQTAASINPQLRAKEKNAVFRPTNELAVIGISDKENLTERIMTLYPSNIEMDPWLLLGVHNLLNGIGLKIETENFIFQLHQRYEYLPLLAEENNIWTKFSRSVVERFVLDFCRNYPHYSDTERSIARWYKVEEYNIIYNTTLQHLQDKKGQTAIQFAAPVRRAIDIYKVILDLPIGIVHSSCLADMPHWLCSAEYVVQLVEVSKTCEHAWNHALVHLTILRSIRQANGSLHPANEVITELNSRISSLDQNNDANYLFDFVIKTLDDLRETLREPLLEEASIYDFVRKLQSEDKLNCLNIDEQGL